MIPRITKITVILQSQGTDLVCIHTDCPAAVYGKENMRMHFHAAHGTGAEYVRTHFGIEPEIIQT